MTLESIGGYFKDFLWVIEGIRIQNECFKFNDMRRFLSFFGVFLFCMCELLLLPFCPLKFCTEMTVDEGLVEGC